MTDQELQIDKLIYSVDNDLSDSRLKKAAQLLIDAMNDWPTTDQTNLFEFIEEFKKEFGNKLTDKKLQGKRTVDNWKGEAQTSVIELLQLYPGNTFGEVVDMILKEYNKK